MKPLRLVASTMLSERDFWQSSLLGRSLGAFPKELLPELWIRFENTGKWGLPEVYNRALEDCPPEKAILFVHDDVFLHDVFLEHRISEGLSQADILGLAGSRGSDLSMPSWGLAFDENLRPTGWQKDAVLSGAVSHVSRYVDPGVQRSLSPTPALGIYGKFPAECDLLDGLFLACRRDALGFREEGEVQGSESGSGQEPRANSQRASPLVRFDERFRYHFYDLDFCRTARKAGLRLSTWPILVSHGSGGNFDTEEFRAAARTYLDKWNAEEGARFKDQASGSESRSEPTPCSLPLNPSHGPIPRMVECTECDALLLPYNVGNHQAWHREKASRAFEELQNSDKEQAASSGFRIFSGPTTQPPNHPTSRRGCRGSVKLDLGCGKKPEEGYVGIDLPAGEAEMTLPLETLPLQAHVDESGIMRFDLASGVPWPFASDSIDGLFSSHVIEHLPAQRIAVYEWDNGSLGQSVLECKGTQDALFWFLDQAWRVTKPGGEFLLRWPALVDQRTGQIQIAPFLDPTHYRFIPIEQHLYWSRVGRASLGVEQYRAVCNWVPKEYKQRELGGGSLKVVEEELLLVKEP